VNNNETYRALLDEGFTQFLTVWAMEAIDGKNMFTSGKQPKHFMPTATRNARCYDSYMLDAMNRDRTEINVHSDGFSGALGQGGGYRNVYNKTATMLYNMQYVLGDSLFQRAMKHYFNQWSFRHPYVEDFRNSIIEYTKVDLNWFFDQWIETSKVIDYKIFPLKKADSGQYLLKLKRKAEMQSPLDITVVGESGKRYNFYVPNTWFEKETDATKLPRWIGWDNKLKTIYTTKINLPEPPKYARIDTSRRLADINELNNTTACAWNLFFDRKNSPPRDRQNYTVLWRPDFWYNNFDGIKAGAHFEGSLNRNFHNTELDVWLNTRIGKWSVRDAVNINSRNALNDLVSFRFSYQSPTHNLVRNSDLRLEARHIDGVALGSIKWRKLFENGNQITIGFKSMLRYRGDQDYYNYMTSIQWNRNFMANTSSWIEWMNNKAFDQNVEQMTRVKLRSSILSAANFSYAEVEHKESVKLDMFLLKWRLFGRLGTNRPFTPSEVLLNAGGASGEEMLENKFMRSVTAFPDVFTRGSQSFNSQEFSHLHYGGGVNLRGYAFRNTVSASGVDYAIYNQNSGLSLNAQLNFEQLSPFKFRKLNRTLSLNTYLFGDIGSVTHFNIGRFELMKAPIISDAGLGAALTWKKPIKYLGLGPMTFRFDMPFFLSHPAQGENNEQLGFRWLVGVEQAF
jgi:aminopeptidase N